MLRYGYFHDPFPRLVIWGGPTDLARLGEALAQCGAGEGPEMLTDIASCLPVDGSSVLFETIGESEGLVRDEVEPDVFHWRVDRDGWDAFEALVVPLSHRPIGRLRLQCHADEDIAVEVHCSEGP